MDLNSAIAKFSDWQRPWEFETRIKSLLPTDSEEIFNTIMAFTHNPENWLNGDFAKCIKKMRKALLMNFPELSENSACSIARATSYQWR